MFVMGDREARDSSDDMIVNRQNHLTINMNKGHLKRINVFWRSVIRFLSGFTLPYNPVNA